jgi:hypothetical protein
MISVCETRVGVKIAASVEQSKIPNTTPLRSFLFESLTYEE